MCATRIWFDFLDTVLKELIGTSSHENLVQKHQFEALNHSRLCCIESDYALYQPSPLNLTMMLIFQTAGVRVR